MTNRDMYKQYTEKYFIDNKYTKMYFKIIDKALCRTNEVIYENHHILPKAKNLYPEYASLSEYPWNKVKLTLREHFLCHRILIKCLVGIQKYSMIYALKRLCHGKQHYTQRNYEIAKLEFIKINKGKTHGSYGKKLSKETRLKMSIRGKGKSKSLSHRTKIGEANSKRKWTDESRKKASISGSNKTLSNIHKKNIGKSTSGIKNGMFGTKWIHHIERQLSFPIHPNKVNEYLISGWKLGQKKYQDRTGKQRNMSILP